MAKTKQNKIKTNAMRLLDAHHITYTTFTYAGDTFHSADEVAALLNIPVQQVYKTLVVLANGGRHLLVMLPADQELDLRQVARAVDAKSVHMAAQREAEQLTGLKVGGISPLALLDKHFEVYLFASSSPLDELYISGGQRGVTLRVGVKDLIAITKASVIQATSVDDVPGHPQGDAPTIDDAACEALSSIVGASPCGCPGSYVRDCGGLPCYLQ